MPAGLFDGFVVHKILSENDRTKSMAVLGRWAKKSEDAVVVLNRRPFDRSTVQNLLVSSSSPELQFENDVYAKYTSLLAPEQGAITVDTICPATHKHISKHTTQSFYMVSESPEIYKERVLPFIRAMPAARIAWVHNILEKKVTEHNQNFHWHYAPFINHRAFAKLEKAEADRLLFEDPDPENGFMLHPDLKWDQTQTEGLYCIALCHRKDLKSLRDLTTQHIPLLRNIKERAYKAIKDKFGCTPQQLRAYVHYHPSYYHFHVHIMHINVDFGPGMAAGKAHLLDDVIDNLELYGSEYYSCRTLHFTLGANDPLYLTCFADRVNKDTLEPVSKKQRT